MAETAVVTPAPVVDAGPKVPEPTPAPLQKAEPTVNGSRSNKVEAKNPAAPIKETKPEAKKEEPKAPYKKFDLDVNGKKVERVYNSDDEIARDIQKILGLEEKMSTMSQKAQAAEDLINLLQSDDPNAWKKFAKQCKANGIDAKKFATEILYEDIEESKMTPEQRELAKFREEKAEQDALKAEEEARKAKEQETAKDAENKAKAEEWSRKFEKECVDALASKKLPTGRLALALVAQYVNAGLSQKKEYSVEEVLPYVKRDLDNTVKWSLESFKTGQELLDYLGPDLVDLITKAKVERYKTTQAQPKKEEKPKINPKVFGKTIKQQMREKPFDSDFGDDY